MGLIAVAHLAARHGIAVTLGTPPGGGTSAEIDLPASLISRQAGGEDPLFWASRFVSGPERPAADEPEPAWEPEPEPEPEPAWELQPAWQRERAQPGQGG